MNIKNFVNNHLSFLKSSRFWQIVVAALAVLLAEYGVIPTVVATTIAAILGVSVTIRTVDRLGEKMASPEIKVNQ